MLLLGSEARCGPKKLAERLSQHRLLRPEKTPGCSVEKWFWERSRISRLLRLDSSIVPKEERLFLGRRRIRESWSSIVRMGIRERRPTAEQSVVLPLQVQTPGQLWTEPSRPRETNTRLVSTVQTGRQTGQYYSKIVLIICCLMGTSEPVLLFASS